MDRPVAIKVMKPQASRVTRERFAREAQLTKRLEHPNTVRLLDFGGLDDDQPFLVWELLRGETLAERLERKGPMPPEEVANMARQVLSSLEEAHGLGIIHRDIKPSNLMLCDFEGEKDFVKVLDFGVAKDVLTALNDLTEEGEVVGTPRYMAPEQVLGKQVVPATDLYALGLVMAEALTGSPMVKASSKTQAVAFQAMETDLPIDPQVLEGPLGRAIRQATRKRLGARFGSSAAMRDTILEEMAAANGPGPFTMKENASHHPCSEPVTLEPVLVSESTSCITAVGTETKKGKTRSRLSVGLGVVVVASLGAGILWLFNPSSPKDMPSNPTVQDTPRAVPSNAFSMQMERDWHPKSEPLSGAITLSAFDPLAFLPEAQVRAQKEFADAALTNIQVIGVWQHSIVNLLAVPNGSATYWFRSQQASTPPASFPSNIAFETRCSVAITVDQRGLSAYMPISTCDEPFVPSPRCGLRNVIERFASTTGTPARHFGFQAYYRSKQGTATWLVEAGSYGSEYLTDDCP
jgi:serine/threonine protein kinase